MAVASALAASGIRTLGVSPVAAQLADQSDLAGVPVDWDLSGEPAILASSYEAQLALLRSLDLHGGPEKLAEFTLKLHVGSRSLSRLPMLKLLDDLSAKAISSSASPRSRCSSTAS